jgi:hypothetical protein
VERFAIKSRCINYQEALYYGSLSLGFRKIRNLKELPIGFFECGLAKNTTNRETAWFWIPDRIATLLAIEIRSLLGGETSRRPFREVNKPSYPVACLTDQTFPVNKQPNVLFTAPP